MAELSGSQPILSEENQSVYAKKANLAAKYMAIAKASQEIAELLMRQTLGLRPVKSEFDSKGLTVRELDVLGLVSMGFSNKEIGSRLFVAEQTVKFHLSHVYSKLEVPNRTAASLIAHELGLLQWASGVEGNSSRTGELMGGTKAALAERQESTS